MQTKEATFMSQRGSWITILDIVLATFTCAAALAVIGGVVSDPPRVAASENRKEGKILPPTARPHGYSLSEIAKITAVFNSGDHSGPPPVTSFQILYTSKTNNNTFDVGPDTMFYVPVIFFDDSPPIAGDFPFAFFNNTEDRDDTGDRKALLHYVFSGDELGVDSMEIKVDDKVFSLGPDYVVGVTTPPLADGGGTHYIPFAAFLTPLTKGTHTVEIDGNSYGKALIPFFPPNGVWEFTIVYTVNVH